MSIGFSIGGSGDKGINEGYKALHLIKVCKAIKCTNKPLSNGIGLRAMVCEYVFDSSTPPIIFMGGVNNNLFRLFTVSKSGNRYTVTLLVRGNSPIIYVFSDDVTAVKKPEYGIEIFDTSGNTTYHSNMSTVEVMGHFTRSKNINEWFKDRAGKNLAIAVVGGMLGIQHVPQGYGPGGAYLHSCDLYGLDSNNNVVFGGDMVYAVPAPAHPSGWNAGVPGKTKDIYVLVIDVSNINISSYL